MRHSQESWHNWGVMQRVKGQLNASTEHVLNETLSRVITLDGISAPDALSFNIPVACKWSATTRSTLKWSATTRQHISRRIPTHTHG